MTKDEFRLQLARSGIVQPERVYQASDIAEQAMAGKFRRSGAPAVSHAYAVAGYMLAIGCTWVEVCAAILHDLDEDTAVCIAVICDLFGPEVADLVEAVTCDKEFSQLGWIAQAVLYYGKLYRCAQRNPRVIPLKLGDRLHYFRTCDVMPPESRERKAHETLDILLPMAAVFRHELADWQPRIQPWIAELGEQSRRYYNDRNEPFAGFFTSPQIRHLHTAPATGIVRPLSDEEGAGGG
ncbi:MAG: HD domain-containing protein [Patescibacteria group bacterium]